MPEFGNAPITNFAWQKKNEFQVVFAGETVVAIQIDNDGFATVEKSTQFKEWEDKIDCL